MYEKTLLIVEDDKGLQAQLRWCFEGLTLLFANDREQALELVRKHKPRVVTLDLGLPPDDEGVSEGFAALEQIHQQSPSTKIIVVTGRDDHANAIRAIGSGAHDFYHKPIEADILGFIVNRAFRISELEEETRRCSTLQETPLDGVIAGSPEMLRVCRTVEKVSPSDASVLILGESGTGKELLVRAMHGLSTRSSGRLVAINCAAIPENLLETELFGYEKGAFTGAAKQTPGKIEHARGGTLFLDEVGDLPMSLQAKLLRFLQERIIERVGGREEIPVDVRVVCATHKDIPELIQDGLFREDLYYRVSEITIRVPPLRERRGDILLLARSFLDQMSRQNDGQIRSFTKDAVGALEAHSWPGNCRELRNSIKRAVIMCEGKQIGVEDLDLQQSVRTMPEEDFNLRLVRDQAERTAILRAISHVDGKISQAAEVLGVSRPTLYDLLKKHNLKV